MHVQICKNAEIFSHKDLWKLPANQKHKGAKHDITPIFQDVCFFCEEAKTSGINDTNASAESIYTMVKYEQVRFATHAHKCPCVFRAFFCTLRCFKVPAHCENTEIRLGVCISPIYHRWRDCEARTPSRCGYLARIISMEWIKRDR